MTIWGSKSILYVSGLDKTCRGVLHRDNIVIDIACIFYIPIYSPVYIENTTVPIILLW